MIKPKKTKVKKSEKRSKLKVWVPCATSECHEHLKVLTKLFPDFIFSIKLIFNSLFHFLYFFSCFLRFSLYSAFLSVSYTVFLSHLISLHLSLSFICNQCYILSCICLLILILALSLLFLFLSFTILFISLSVPLT